MAPKLLLAEEDQHQAGALRDSLQAAGYQVVLARDGHTAWDLIQRQAPDLVLLDVDLPGLASWRVLSYLRLEKGSPGLPVVLLGSPGTTEQVVHWFRMGIDAYVEDACCTRLVLAQVASLLRRQD